MAHYRLRKILISATAVLTAAASSPVAPAVAQGARTLDGEPTAAACANLGFTGRDAGADSSRVFMGSGRAGSGSAPMSSPPPPPPPPPAPPPPPPPRPTLAPPPVQRLEAPPLQPRSVPPPPMVSAPAPYIAGAPEAYPDAQPNPIRQAATEPVSTFSIDVDTAAYANVRRFLNDGQRPPTDAVRVEELVNYFDYAYPRPASRQSPFRPTVAVAPSPWAQGKEVIHIGVQGFAPPRDQEPPLNLVFLVDTSGSMNGPDRLQLAHAR